MKLLTLILFPAACLAAWGLVFAFAACAARYIGIWPAVCITGACLGAILVFFWYETKTAK